MKIIDLKMYGTTRKTFVAAIEEYNVEDSEEVLKDKITVMIYGIISALGFDREKIDIMKDVSICDFKRIDKEGAIFCTINVENLV